MWSGLGWILLGAALQIESARVIPAITIEYPPGCYCTESTGEADCSIQEYVEYPFYGVHVFENIASLDISGNRIPKVVLHTCTEFPNLGLFGLDRKLLHLLQHGAATKFYEVKGDCIKQSAVTESFDPVRVEQLPPVTLRSVTDSTPTTKILGTLTSRIAIVSRKTQPGSRVFGNTQPSTTTASTPGVSFHASLDGPFDAQTTTGLFDHIEPPIIATTSPSYSTLSSSDFYRPDIAHLTTKQRLVKLLSPKWMTLPSTHVSESGFIPYIHSSSEPSLLSPVSVYSATQSSLLVEAVVFSSEDLSDLLSSGNGITKMKQRKLSSEMTSSPSVALESGSFLTIRNLSRITPDISSTEFSLRHPTDVLQLNSELENRTVIHRAVPEEEPSTQPKLNITEVVDFSTLASVNNSCENCICSPYQQQSLPNQPALIPTGIISALFV